MGNVIDEVKEVMDLACLIQMGGLFLEVLFDGLEGGSVVEARVLTVVVDWLQGRVLRYLNLLTLLPLSEPIPKPLYLNLGCLYSQHLPLPSALQNRRLRERRVDFR